MEVKQIEDILNYFKNFFTLSDATFIFIGGEEIFNIDSTNVHGKKLYRNKNYTYFTSKYFIPRPLWPDLKSFIGSIIEEISGEELNHREYFERALCFDSKNDFYDIKKFIKDRITGFDDQNRPIIELTLSDEDMKKAKFHKVMTILFEEKYKLEGHSKWAENEDLIRDLFGYANDVYLSYDGSTFEDPVGDDSKSEIIRDFNAFLYRLQAFEIEGRKPVNTNQFNNNKAGPKRDSVLIYRYTGSIPDEPPSFLEEATSFEKRFINTYLEYVRYNLSLINALRKAIRKQELGYEDLLNLPNGSKNEIISVSGDIFMKLLNKYYRTYEVLINNANIYKDSRETTEENITILNNHISGLKRALPTYISNIIKSAYSDPDATNKSLKDNIEYFSFLSDLQRSSLKNCRILVKSDLSKQLMFMEENALDQIADEIEAKSATHRVILLSEKAKGATKLKGVHVIVTESPEALKNSLDKLLDGLKTFWLNR